MPALEIVVGIDFGTTYSGASWAINAGERQVHLVDDWPNPVAANITQHKVPSLLSYNNRGQPVKWGYNVTVGTDTRVLRWFKLLVESLDYDNDMIEPLRESENLLRSMSRSRIDATSDYLRWIWESTKENIRIHQGDNWNAIYDVSVILTVPAIWSARAKARTKRIAHIAGLPENTKLVPEPEAAALAAFKDLLSGTSQQTLRKDDAFVVCDAGGGTVDLISYQIKSLHPFKIEECTPGTGGLYGSTLIDRCFENDIRTRIGPRTYDKMSPRRRARIFENFEAVKRSFNGDDREEHIVDLPGIRDNPAARIRDQAIQLTPSMLRTLFDHVCNQVIHLVDNQIEDARAENCRVKMVRYQ
ncbi:hsp70 protein [Diplodia corticola]|uniref:Hsp70 protein n=1 Tax=Diplodia corticola TaxID=236234 RepID=A0A1J9R6W5_9PEZI|nr:hsp70 protein [Diplodia corticola]OJD35962.1 hsp70 protein [Diplodia corticola]